MSLLKLTNAPFEIEFNGKPYMIRKASLEQVIKFMQRADEYKKANVPIMESWIKLVSFALFILLSPTDNTLTEEFIASNIPGDCNPTDVLMTLGFIRPVPTVAPSPSASQTTESSLPPSPTGQDGLQTK